MELFWYFRSLPIYQHWSWLTMTEVLLLESFLSSGILVQVWEAYVLCQCVLFYDLQHLNYHWQWLLILELRLPNFRSWIKVQRMICVMLPIKVQGSMAKFFFLSQLTLRLSLCCYISPLKLQCLNFFPSLFAVQFQKFHISLQKWFSMGFVALLFVDHVNFVSLFYLTRTSCWYIDSHATLKSIYW